MKLEKALHSQKLAKISLNTKYNLEWLKNDNYQGPIIDPDIQDKDIAEKSPEYDLYGGLKPRLVGEDYEYAGKALEILASKTAYSIALRANINAFYNALKADMNQEDMRKTIEALETRIAEIEDKKNEKY